MKPIENSMIIDQQSWDGRYYQRLPILRQFEKTVGRNNTTWPTLQALNQALTPEITNANGAAIRFVEQEDLTRNYELQIYEQGHVATRTQNWHDYFNAHVWLNYPRTKAMINALQYHSLSSRKQKGQRSQLENAMTLFDENGALIICSNPRLLSLLHNHEWLELFYHQKKSILAQMRVLIVGHSMHEKALFSYVGMTCHCLVFEHPDPFSLSLLDIDNMTARRLYQERAELTPKALQPLPILGYPGWYNESQDVGFYKNTRYFRPKRAET